MMPGCDAWPMFEQYNDVVTVKELCGMLQIGLNAAYDLVNTRTIASVRLGRKIRIPKQAVIDYLTNGCAANNHDSERS